LINGVIPSNDLGRAHRFWERSWAGIDHLTNLNIRGLNAKCADVFYTLANHKGWACIAGLSDFFHASRPLEGASTASKSQRMI